MVIVLAVIDTLSTGNVVFNIDADTLNACVKEGLMSVTEELIRSVTVGLMYVTGRLLSVTERLILLCGLEGLMTVNEDGAVDCWVSVVAGDTVPELCADVPDTMRGKRTANISSLVCDDVIDVDVEPVICIYRGVV